MMLLCFVAVKSTSAQGPVAGSAVQRSLQVVYLFVAYRLSLIAQLIGTALLILIDCIAQLLLYLLSIAVVPDIHCPRHLHTCAACLHLYLSHCSSHYLLLASIAYDPLHLALSRFFLKLPPSRSSTCIWFIAFMLLCHSAMCNISVPYVLIVT